AGRRRPARPSPRSCVVELRRSGHFWIGGLARAAAALMLACAMLAVPAAAQAQTQTQAATRVPVDVQINLLMQNGDFAAALALAERAWGPETPNRAARLDFIRGMKAKAEGDLATAIAIFRRLI